MVGAGIIFRISEDTEIRRCPNQLRSEYLHTICTCPLVCFTSPVSHLYNIRDAVQMVILRIFRKQWPKCAESKCNCFKRSISIYVCVCQMCTGAFRGQRRMTGPSELVLQGAGSRQIRHWQWKSGSLNQVLPC